MTDFKKIFLTLVLASCPFTGAFAAVSAYISPPGGQSAPASGITGVTRELFLPSDIGLGTFTSFESTIGTYTSDGGTTIIGNNQFGGYRKGQYLGINPGDFTLLELDQPAGYFGLLFSAGDGGNSFEAYDSNGRLIFLFNNSALIAQLPNVPLAQVTAINGTQYNTEDYYGQPVTGANPAEPYVYLHLVADADTKISTIIFRQAIGGGIFETDDHAVRATAPIVPSTLVSIQGLGIPVSIPEPSSLALLALSSILLLRRSRD